MRGYKQKTGERIIHYHTNYFTSNHRAFYSYREAINVTPTQISNIFLETLYLLKKESSQNGYSNTGKSFLEAGRG